MEKMAIFVEGQTEQAFAEALVYEVAGRHRVHIDKVHAFGGRVCTRTFLEVTASSRPDQGKHYYVIIYDSSNDSRVLSDIRDHYENLVAQGFWEIVAIRDVFPQTYATVPAVRAAFASLVPSAPVAVTLVLAILEIEAWFIGEHTHFPRIHAALSHQACDRHSWLRPRNARRTTHPPPVRGLANGI